MKSIRKYTLSVLAIGAAIACIHSANAADLPGRTNYSTPAFASNWAGFYTGVHLGYGMGRARSADLDGFLGGVQVGFNAQADRFVFGGEADVAYSGIDYRAFADTFRQKWIGSGRVRLGYAFERFLPYVTAGLAFTSATMKAGGAKSSNVHAGVVLGLGGEMMITNNVSANLQFLHYRFNAQDYAVLPARNANIVTNSLRIGLNYRF